MGNVGKCIFRLFVFLLQPNHGFVSLEYVRNYTAKLKLFFVTVIHYATSQSED